MPDILRIYQRKEGVSKFISLIEIDQSRYREAARGQTRDDLRRYDAVCQQPFILFIGV
jgi:hypothetical protein